MTERPTSTDGPDTPGPEHTAEPGDRGPTDTGAASGSLAPGSISRRRLILVDALIAVTTVLAVVAMFSVYANRLLFSPDNWATTSTQLLQNSTIRSETANYLVDQLYANVNVAGLIKSGLPPRLAPLAGPAAGALQNAAVQGVELALTRPRVQTLWANANRAADQTFVAIVNGGKGAVKVNGGAVSLNLASIVDTVAARLGLPPNLGAKLPKSVANLTVFKSDQLKYVQNGGKAVKGLALWLTILVPLLYLLAIFLARGHRRRTLMTVGFAIVFAGVVGWAGRSILESQVTNGLVSDASLRPAVHAVLVIATGLLGQIVGAFILVGLVVVVAAWFAGPARVAVVARRAVAPFLREHVGATFAIAAAVMVLIFIWDPIPATGTPGGIIVFLLLALFGTEMLRRQTAVEFPDARPGDATNAIRERLQARRDRRQRNKGSAVASTAPNAPLPDQLERLAALRDRGEITAEEYNTAKASLLTTAT
jgi:Short C-terminal domain